MEKDKQYQAYATWLVKDVPHENMKWIIEVAMKKAALNMGCEYDKEIENPVYEIIFKKFTFLPVCYIASAFIKGSLGDYGAGRFNPRTIYLWLNETVHEYKRIQIHEKQIKEGESVTAFNLHKFPVGSAIIRKMDWVKSGILSIDDWEKIPLKELAERIGQGLPCFPEIWGIKSLTKITDIKPE